MVVSSSVAANVRLLDPSCSCGKAGKGGDNTMMPPSSPQVFTAIGQHGAGWRGATSSADPQNLLNPHMASAAVGRAAMLHLARRAAPAVRPAAGQTARRMQSSLRGAWPSRSAGVAAAGVLRPWLQQLQQQLPRQQPLASPARLAVRTMTSIGNTSGVTQVIKRFYKEVTVAPSGQVSLERERATAVPTLRSPPILRLISLALLHPAGPGRLCGEARRAPAQDTEREADGGAHRDAGRDGGD